MKRGKFLAKLRIKVGLSQNDIAEALNYSPQLVSLWELDKAQPDLRIISKYASLLNVDLKAFINVEEKLRNNNCKEKEFDPDKFASNLRLLRKQKNLLQSDIANQLKTNVKTIGSWENGLSTPTIDNFIALCALFNKSYEQMYFGIEDGKKYKDDKKRGIFLPIFLPVILCVSVAGTSTGIALGVSQKNKPGPHVHQYSTHTIEPTYESDGSITYTCTCGDTYTEVIPMLIHQYEDTWSHDNLYHWHQCIDEGYESLVKDKEEHHITSETVGDVTTYSCTECEYNFSTNDYIIVSSLLNSDGEIKYSHSQRNSLYLRVLNVRKYPVKYLGYKIKDINNPTTRYSGYIDLRTRCLDAPNYTLFELDFAVFETFASFTAANSECELVFEETTVDTDLLGVTCDPIYISFVD